MYQLKNRNAAGERAVSLEKSLWGFPAGLKRIIQAACSGKRDRAFPLAMRRYRAGFTVKNSCPDEFIRAELFQKTSKLVRFGLDTFFYTDTLR